MPAQPSVYIGVTAWNSEWLLPACLDSIRKTAPSAHVEVWDNCSTDSTVEIARAAGVRVIQQRSSQADAMQGLARRSRCTYTLLIHADVVFLSSSWTELCISAFRAQTALLSPEDIGCGPFSRRSHGAGKPESSFLFFATKHIDALRVRRWRRRFRIPFYRRDIDFYGEHVTYNLPGHIAAAGLSWVPMSVHISDSLPEPLYIPTFQPVHWSAELAHLRYGLGNFYGLQGRLTHFHNWYDRRVKNRPVAPLETVEGNGLGVPTDFVHTSTQRFLHDFYSGSLVIPAELRRD